MINDWNSSASNQLSQAKQAKLGKRVAAINQRHSELWKAELEREKNGAHENIAIIYSFCASRSLSSNAFSYHRQYVRTNTRPLGFPLFVFSLCGRKLLSSLSRKSTHTQRHAAELSTLSDYKRVAVSPAKNQSDAKQCKLRDCIDKK